MNGKAVLEIDSEWEFRRVSDELKSVFGLLTVLTGEMQARACDLDPEGKARMRTVEVAADILDRALYTMGKWDPVEEMREAV